MDWKIINISALINAIISLTYFPLIFIGPIIGGFIAAYFTKGFEDYEKMDKKDGAVLGAMSGIIGGLIIGLMSILGVGAISQYTNIIYDSIGSMPGDFILTWYIILQISLIISIGLGLIGGIMGVSLKKVE